MFYFCLKTMSYLFSWRFEQKKRTKIVRYFPLSVQAKSWGIF